MELPVLQENSKMPGAVYELLRVLVEAGDEEVLWYLHETLTDTHRRDALIDVLIGSFDRPWVAELVRRMAEDSPHSIGLALFRRDGLKYLLVVAFDRNADVDDRYESLHWLGLFGDRAVRDALLPLRDDPTPRLRRSVTQPASIGAKAVESINRIDSRLSEAAVAPAK